MPSLATLPDTTKLPVALVLTLLLMVWSPLSEPMNEVVFPIWSKPVPNAESLPKPRSA